MSLGSGNVDKFIKRTMVQSSESCRNLGGKDHFKTKIIALF